MDLKQRILNMDSYKKALVEVDAIIEAIDISEQEKIPLKFREFIKQKKSKEYVYNIDKNKKLVEQNIMQETKIIFSLIYRSYFCTEEERLVLKQKDIEEIKRKDKELKEKYNPDNIFKTKVKQEIYETQNNKELIEYKPQSFIQKLFAKIKNIFIRK